MHQEITIKTAQAERKVFLQEGFYTPEAMESPLHQHAYAEVHLIANGAVTMRIGKSEYLLKAGNVLVVPPNTYHYLTPKEEKSLHVAFQIDYAPSEPILQELPSGFLGDLFKAIEQCAVTADHTDVTAYLTFICFSLWGREHVMIKKITDHNILIREFFSHNYNRDVHLADLARELHLSERQTERLVIAHTGKTFRRELTAARLEMANYLMQNTELSMNDIAQYVGYQSYAGFWKAMKAHTENTSHPKTDPIRKDTP